MSIEETDLLDGYFRNSLDDQSRRILDEMMRKDPEFRARAEEHLQFLQTLKDHADRKALRQSLEELHGAIPQKQQNTGSWLRYWPSVAIAASVALVSILGTYFSLRYYQTEHQAEYIILRRNLETLTRSHNRILADMKARNKNAEVPGKYSGSGFLISNAGYIATSYHVVHSADSIVVENEKFGRLKTSLVYGDEAADVALLLITDSRFAKPAQAPGLIRAGEANIGEAVYTLGYPREDVVFGDGSISANSGFQHDTTAYQMSIPVNPGNSGGPVIDQQGAVVGIVSGVQTETRGTAFATKSDILLSVINSMPKDSLAAPLSLAARNSMSGQTRVNQIKRWKDFVFMVKVYNGK